VTEKDPNKVVDDIAASIKQLLDELENREKNGETLKSAEVRAVANQLQTHVAHLLSAVSQLRREKAGK
jgi:hypothetical protein